MVIVVIVSNGRLFLCENSLSFFNLTATLYVVLVHCFHVENKFHIMVAEADNT